ncbi:serine/arginine repetitive matrix protein 2 [Xylanimonas allomyrinae]|uniref:Serine/arginine repetitive matrix protein 2 n=1 Tax=Xylanimonas allomyrinae TaxID=2509459 RepID=A0A4P6EKV9_9MICO|nr:serine/arginine repetitive matrix protein 2 [Xylanimonas allomyrinae]QAY63244.1 serine/arginine repetitive matrix protein 2 [Xylanimonas allomyrinae]
MEFDRSSLSERDAKLDAVHERLARAVEDLTSAEDWRRMAVFAARWPARSWANNLLILVQHRAAFEAGLVPFPDPVYPAGYGQLKAMGYQVRRGQHGYAILAPVTQRLVARNPDTGPWRALERSEKPAPGETVRTRLVGVRPATVFDVTQTDFDVDSLPKPPPLLVGAAPPGLWDGLAVQVAERGFRLALVADADALGGANGLTSYRDLVVSVRGDMDGAARVKTLAHELAHVMLHGPDNPDGLAHRSVAEVEAETVALMVGAAHQMDTSTYTVPYVSTWASRVEGKTPVEVVLETAERSRRAAATVLDRLDTVQVGRIELPARRPAPRPPDPAQAPAVAPAPVVDGAQP